MSLGKIVPSNHLQQLLVCILIDHQFVFHQNTLGNLLEYIKGSHLFPSNVCYYFLRILLTKTYTVEDCKLYATMSKIKSDWLKDTSVSGRTIYKLMTAYNTDVELTFKLQTSIPSNYLIGFGDTGGSPAYWSKCAWFNDNNSLKIFKNNDYVNIGSPSKTLDTVYKLRTSNLHTITPYLNNTSYSAQSTNSGHSLNLRVDDYGNVLDIEYLKVKPL